MPDWILADQSFGPWIHISSGKNIGDVSKILVIYTVAYAVVIAAIAAVIAVADEVEVVVAIADEVESVVAVKAIVADKFNILEAGDGEEALLMANKHTPHLILMDISLPGMDGIQALISPFGTRFAPH